MVLPLWVQIYNPSDPIRISNLGYTKKKRRADCGGSIQQMGSQKQRTPAKLCSMCARRKVTRIENLGKSERASVVERGNTLTGVKGISEVVNRSLSREYVEMVGIDDGCVGHMAERFVAGMLWAGDVDRKLGRLSHPGSQDA